MMSDTTPQHDIGDEISRSSTEDVVEDELPMSQPSDAEHSPIHDQLTAPMGSCKMTYVRRQVGDDDDSNSESDVDNDRKDDDDGDGGDDEKSVHLSNYVSDEAVSYVESCESFDRFTDSSDEEESDEDNTGESKKKAGVSRRRESNSDSDIDEESEEDKVCNSSNQESNLKEAAKSGNVNSSSSMNNFTEVTKKKSSEKFVGIWDDDGTKRKRSTNPVRKLWSDYVYKSDAKQSRGQMRAGARFTNSFTDKRQPEPVDQSWGMSPSNHFPPHLGLGLGRGLVPNNNRYHESNSMRPPGPSRSWQQQRRPNNPYCHYQQQQKYFGMPRGSYASVVRKGAPNAGRTDSRNPTPTIPRSRSRQGSDNGFSQQSHNRQNQQQQQRPLGPGPQRQQQSYNRGTVTAAQILQQQRMQQSQRQQGQQAQQSQTNQTNRQAWQPPKGPHVRPIMIGTQEVYLIQPSFDRHPIAEEDPAIVRAEPPVPHPYLMLPGGIPLALPTAMRVSTYGGNPAGQTKTSGSGGMHGTGINQRATAVN